MITPDSQVYFSLMNYYLPLPDFDGVLWVAVLQKLNHVHQTVLKHIATLDPSLDSVC